MSDLLDWVELSTHGEGDGPCPSRKNLPAFKRAVWKVRSFSATGNRDSPPTPCLSITRSIKVGEGGVCAVYKETLNGVPVAVKVPRETDMPSNDKKLVEHVVKVYRRVATDHPNIVRCSRASVGRLVWPTKRKDRFSVEGETVYIVLEFLPTSLETLMNESESFATTGTYRKLLGIFVDIARGLEFLHRNYLPHNNLKPSNVRITDTGTAKLCDFRPVVRAAREEMEADVAALGELLMTCLTRNGAVSGEERRVVQEFLQWNENCLASGAISAGQVVCHLEHFLRRPWADQLLPWVAENCRQRARSGAHLEPGTCSIIPKRECLGHGAFGSVFRGHYKDIDDQVHDVAIKLTNRLELRKAAEVLGNELAVLNRLAEGHQNIVKCHGGNLGDGAWAMEHLQRIDMPQQDHFLVLEYLPQNLHQLLYKDEDFRSTCTYRQMIGIFIDIANGLCFLQENMVVHCNLKPSNVMIDGNRIAKLADFGEAKIRVKDSMTKNARGTVGYMAPELVYPCHLLQTDGHPRITDKVDVFSFGVIMAQCLTLNHPVDMEFGNQPAELWALISECYRHDVLDGGSSMARPSHTEVQKRLHDMLRRIWIDDFLPWVDQDDQTSTSTSSSGPNSFGPGSCFISGGKTFAKAVYSGTCFVGWYKDASCAKHKVAIKVPENFREFGGADGIHQELELFDRLGDGHPNIVRCFGGSVGNSRWEMNNLRQIHMDNEKIFLVLELLPKSLEQLLYKDQDFAKDCTYRKMIDIFIGVAKGLAHLHENNVVPFDLNPSIVLISEDGTPKLTDFGSSEIRLRQSISSSMRGTSGYIAPELLLTTPTAERFKKVNIYTLGMMMREFASRTPPDKYPAIQPPDELEELIRACCALKSTDAEGLTDCPTAAAVVEKLSSMRDCDWMNRRLPWVEEGEQRSALAQQSANGCSNICCSLGILEKTPSVESHRALYLDGGGQVHEVAVNVSGKTTDAFRGDLRTFDRLADDTHPNVVKCFGGNLDADNWEMETLQNVEMGDVRNFSAMEWHPADLQKLLYEDPDFGRICTYRQMINKFVDIAEGLYHLHQNCTVVCDLSPRNVLVTADGQVKLGGLRELTTRHHRAIPWRLAGTLGYIAPEMWFPRHAGGNLQLTDSLDVFALGAMLLECLTRQHPYDVQKETCPELWTVIEGSCGTHVQEDGKGRYMTSTTDGDVRQKLIKNVNGDWIWKYLPWPVEFWELADEHNGDLPVERSEQSAGEVLKRLKKLVKQKEAAEKLPWPPEMCLLIVRCVSFIVEDGRHFVTRPSASQIALLLKDMLRKPWADSFLPWVDEHLKSSKMLGVHLDINSCCFLHSPEMLASGTTGDVWKALYKDSVGCVHTVVVKFTNRMTRSDAEEMVKTELKKADKLTEGHPNVVQCFGGSLGDATWEFENVKRIKFPEQELFVVMELCVHNLYDALFPSEEFRKDWTYRKVLMLFIGMASGVQFLHENGVVHHTLNPSNILIDAEGTAKLTGLGCENVRGRLGYMAPELQWPPVHPQQPIPRELSDIFSLGVIFAECLTGQSPMELEFREEPPELWRLIRDCCKHNVVDVDAKVDRPSAGEIVESLNGMLGASWVDASIG